MKIREAHFRDSRAITQLAGEMGYVQSDDMVANNLLELAESPDHQVLVSLDESSSVTGWLHVFIARRLGSPAFAEIGGLVVAQAGRRQGAGTSLIQAASQWALEKGVSTIRVRTNTSRSATLKFYCVIGFKLLKDQSVFEKKM